MDSATSSASGNLARRLNLTWLHRLLNSSIGRKFVMGVTGLLLCGFLVGHLAGNLLLFKGEQDFNEYAEWIHHQKVLPLVELGLLLLFLAHIYLAFVTTIENRKARKQRYAVKESKQHDLALPIPAHNWMFISGSIILAFLLLHMVDLRVGIRPGINYEATAFSITVQALSNPISRIAYIVGPIILGFHLAHGFASAFQSLGLNHPKYNGIIHTVSIAFGIAIGAGFASLPILVPGMAERSGKAAASSSSTPGTPAAKTHGFD
ncbi:MAG: succinate dehydrogenase [Planctomyces sp.]|nr:succinate dehydrogenase [Planctomyces sp.]